MLVLFIGSNAIQQAKEEKDARLYFKFYYRNNFILFEWSNDLSLENRRSYIAG